MRRSSDTPATPPSAPAEPNSAVPGQEAVQETVNVDSDDLYPVFVSAVAESYDRGFAGMPTLTDLVEAIRPIEELYASS
jgi:hypothetical protein